MWGRSDRVVVVQHDGVYSHRGRHLAVIIQSAVRVRGIVVDLKRTHSFFLLWFGETHRP